MLVLILYIPVNKSSVTSRWVFLCWTSTKQWRAQPFLNQWKEENDSSLHESMGLGRDKIHDQWIYGRTRYRLLYLAWYRLFLIMKANTMGPDQTVPMVAVWSVRVHIVCYIGFFKTWESRQHWSWMVVKGLQKLSWWHTYLLFSIPRVCWWWSFCWWRSVLGLNHGGYLLFWLKHWTLLKIFGNIDLSSTVQVWGQLYYPEVKSIVKMIQKRSWLDQIKKYLCLG